MVSESPESSFCRSSVWNGLLSNSISASCVGRLSTAFGLASWHAIAFGFLCVVVAVISVHDALLVVVNYEVIGSMEQNPAGRWLLALQGGEVWLFVVVKLAMTALVCALLVDLYEYWKRGGLMVVAGVAGFQSMLLCYLTFL